MKILPFVIAIITLTGLTPAQNRFSDLHTAWQKGRDVATELAALSDDEQASTKDRFNACYLMAVISLAAGEGKESLAILDRAEKLHPGTPQVALRRAEALLQTEQIDKAAKALTAAGKKIKGKKSALAVRLAVLRSRLDIKKGRHKKAAQRLRSMSKAHKKSWEIPFFLGRASEMLDKPKDALEAYERCIKNLPKTDPCPGIYALQRWSALAVSSDKGSYGNRKLLEAAIQRYKEFLGRAEKNGVPDKLVQNVQNTVRTLEMFSSRRR